MTFFSGAATVPGELRFARVLLPRARDFDAARFDGGACSQSAQRIGPPSRSDVRRSIETATRRPGDRVPSAIFGT